MDLFKKSVIELLKIIGEDENFELILKDKTATEKMTYTKEKSVKKIEVDKFLKSLSNLEFNKVFTAYCIGRELNKTLLSVEEFFAKNGGKSTVYNHFSKNENQYYDEKDKFEELKISLKRSKNYLDTFLLHYS